MYDYYEKVAELGLDEELIQALITVQEMYESMADYADDTSDIDKEEMPRPPKKIGPVNKVNYTYNRPQRRARSNCRTFKR